MRSDQGSSPCLRLCTAQITQLGSLNSAPPGNSVILLQAPCCACDTKDPMSRHRWVGDIYIQCSFSGLVPVAVLLLGPSFLLTCEYMITQSVPAGLGTRAGCDSSHFLHPRAHLPASHVVPQILYLPLQLTAHFFQLTISSTRLRDCRTMASWCTCSTQV